MSSEGVPNLTCLEYLISIDFVVAADTFRLPAVNSYLSVRTSGEYDLWDFPDVYTKRRWSSLDNQSSRWQQDATQNTPPNSYPRYIAGTTSGPRFHFASKHLSFHL